MRLTCPKCRTRYKITEEKFGSHARKVICVSCGYSWRQKAGNVGASTHSFKAGNEEAQSQEANSKRLTIHYAWVIVSVAMLVVLAAVGLARFSFGVILPAIAIDLGLDYKEQGFLSASYFFGYLIAVPLTPWLTSRVGYRYVCASGLFVVAFGMFGMSVGRGYNVLFTSYLITGIGSGAAFIAAMSLPTFWFHGSHRARGTGIVVAGAGLGILLSGLLVSKVSGSQALGSWQTVWFIFAIITLSFSLLSLIFLRNRPSDCRASPYGSFEDRNGSHPQTASPVRARVILAQLGIIYFLFAITMITYTTFFITTLMDRLAVTAEFAGMLWAGVGGLSIFSGAIFGYISDLWGHRWGLLAALLMQSVAYATVSVGENMIWIFVSILLFGLSAWSLPSILAAAAGDYLGSENAAAGFSILTLIFAAGQVLGPVGAGVLADVSGSFSLSYGVAAALCVVAATSCLLLKSPLAIPIK